MVSIHSFALSHLVILSLAGAAATASCTSKPVEHHFWKPFPAWHGGGAVTNTITETVTLDPVTVVQTQVSTLTLQCNPIVVTTAGPGTTVVQTVVVSHPPETETSTLYKPVFETSTQTNVITQTHTTTSISTHVFTLPGEITTATLVPNTKTVMVSEYVTVACPTTISYGVPTTETITLPADTETVYIPTSKTVYYPTTVSVHCGCPHTPNCLPTPPPLPCCSVCNAPVEQCVCLAATSPSTERDPIPVMLHRKIMNKARNYINSEDREINGENWKTPSQISAHYKKKLNQQSSPYERYRKENVPCGCNDNPEHLHKYKNVERRPANKKAEPSYQYDKAHNRWVRLL